MMRALLLASVVAAGWVGFGVHTASAAFFTESVQFGPGPVDYRSSTGTTAGPGGNQLYYFDANGGTLTSIGFSYAYSVSSQITLSNTSATASSGTVRVQSAAQFSANASSIAAALNSVVNNYVDPIDGTSVHFGNTVISPIAADVRGSTSSYNLPVGSSSSLNSSGSYARATYTVTDASVLAAFSQAGGGTFTPLLDTLSGLIVSNSGGNTSGTEAATAQANLVITYNYTAVTPTAVPEPATLALLGLPLGLLGLVAMRRRHSAAGA